MTNKSKLISLIKEANDKELNNEIQYFLEVDREYEYGTADGFDDAATFAEENNLRRLLKVCRIILIKAGFYREAPENTVALGSDTRFTCNGKKYDSSTHWDGWIND